MIKSWKIYFEEAKNRYEFIISTISIVVVLILLTKFLVFVENRPGVCFDDPVLSLFSPINLTWLIFTLIYLSLAAAIYSLIKSPKMFVAAVQLYTLMVLVRMFCMYIVPLNPPRNMIILLDPFVEFFGTGRTLTKDLFFSGHTATLLIFYLTAKDKRFKNFFLICTIGVAVSVLLQHVHYTIDVVAALFFTFGIYEFLRYVRHYNF